jgi:hypothetical protein
MNRSYRDILVHEPGLVLQNSCFYRGIKPKRRIRCRPAHERSTNRRRTVIDTALARVEACLILPDPRAPSVGAVPRAYSRQVCTRSRGWQELGGCAACRVVRPTPGLHRELPA